MERWLRDADVPGYVEEPAGATAPLSISQEESWYQAALQRDEPTYQEYDAVLIRGPVDVAAMEHAIAALAARHDAFRVVYPAERGMPSLRYLDRPVLPFTFVDERERAVDDPRGFAEAYVRRAVREVFDLSAAPPAHAHLVRVADEMYLFVIVIFHIIKDGTTEGILMRDVSRFYASYLSGEPADLPPLPTTLGEYARWQRRLEAAGAFDENVAYWSETLRGATAVDVPTDFPRPAILSDAGARTYRLLPSAAVAQLRALAHAENASLFMALMTAFALFIHRYSAADEIPIAFPVRNRAERLRPLVGCFINTLIARNRCDDALSFREHLRATRQTLIGAYQHQDAPFSRVVQQLAPPRRSDQTALAAALLLLRNPRIERLELPGCRCERMEIDVGIAKFDLSIECDELAEGLRIGLEYRTSLFEAVTARRMAANFEALLDAVIAEPDVPFGALDALAPDERVLIERWSRGPDRPRTATLVDDLRAAAARVPDQPAIVDGARSMSYGELLRAASSIAAALCETQRPRTIAVYGARSLERVVASVGTMLAGAAFLPIDGTYPEPRVRFMLQDAGADAVLLARADALERDWPVPALIIDDLIERPAAPEPSARPAAANPAYVMYTSGSTGSPNAVVVPHRAVANYLDVFRTVCAVGPGDRVLQLTSPSFDISIEETFGALCAGATLAVSRAGIANAVAALFDECSALGITVLDLPTAYFNEVVAALEADGALPPSIRAVIVGGEALTRERAAAFLRRAPGVRLINGYGPTEAAIAVTLAEVTAECVQSPYPLSIGRPIQNVRLALVGETVRPVPIGAAGEIAIGGVAPADGYRGRPALDAERFASDPVSGERLYLTGDLGRYAPDGALQFLGRRDEQTKVRGFRVEPAEIEALLLRENGVRDAAVFVDGAQRLVACVVGAVTLRSDALRERLAQALPAFAVPDRIVTVPAIPLTANGKRDRAHLERLATPQPRRARRAARDHELTPVEQQLTTIWEEALGRHPIGIDEDFFELGGHSLLSARMFTRIEAAFGRRLPLQILFAHPTIAAIARALEDGTGAPDSLVTAHQGQRTGRPIFFVHGDFNGGGLYTRRLAEQLRLERPFYALAPHGSIGDPIPATIEAMADDYVRMIREIQPEGPYTVGGFCLGAAIAIEIARRLGTTSEVDPVLAIQPPTDVYLLAPLTAAANAFARRIGRPHAASALMGLAKRPWRGFERAWRWSSKLLDPRRRALAYAAFTRRWHRYVVQRRFEPDTPFWGGHIGDELVRVVNRYVPVRYDGPLDVMWAFESGAGPFAGLALRRAARSSQTAYTPGSHVSALNVYTDELADVFSDFLEGMR